MQWRFASLMLALAMAVTIDAAPNTDVNVAKAYNKAANLNEASLMTELVFDPGSSDLTVDARGQLRDLLASARARGEIKEVKVIAWADKEYPSKRRSLDRSSRRIAADRALETRNYFTDNAGDLKVEIYNMAQQPYALERLFNTSDDSRVKKSLEVSGLAHPRDSKLPSKASRVLVMIVQ
jgi:hypothetical protein